MAGVVGAGGTRMVGLPCMAGGVGAGGTHM
jgi:hypothetical protein